MFHRGVGGEGKGGGHPRVLGGARLDLHGDGHRGDALGLEHELAVARWGDGEDVPATPGRVALAAAKGVDDLAVGMESVGGRCSAPA